MQISENALIAPPIVKVPYIASLVRVNARAADKSQFVTLKRQTIDKL
jgi:hypothetical protein